VNLQDTITVEPELYIKLEQMKSSQEYWKKKFEKNPDINIKLIETAWNRAFFEGVGRSKSTKIFKIEYFMEFGTVKLKNYDGSLTTHIVGAMDIDREVKESEITEKMKR
jgi:hypothetical protein